MRKGWHGKRYAGPFSCTRYGQMEIFGREKSGRLFLPNGVVFAAIAWQDCLDSLFIFQIPALGIGSFPRQYFHIHHNIWPLTHPGTHDIVNLASGGERNRLTSKGNPAYIRDCPAAVSRNENSV